MDHIYKFKKALETYLRGQSSDGRLQHALDECIASSDCRIDLVRKLLDKASAAGLDPALERTLRNRLYRPTGNEPTMMPDVTGREDATVTVTAGADDVTSYTEVTGGESTGDGDEGSSDTGAGWPTDTHSATNPRRRSSVAIGPGTVLKDRFELLEALGEGGMGVVYKAVDRLKVEARDRNPYLAIKLLTVDFQTHPEAFISLQRESAKAQRLAHPNIATVYDFDRDRGTIYMTMELLTGHALNHFIRRKIPAGGLPEKEAMAMIRQLCAGLSYAHQANLVHSDLKPGNCWLSDDGTMKLLDFGIARASKTKMDESGETTVFDPGQLGALTPAYATVEMFDAEAPDPRDDIYALACISFELLTGKHPFNKVPAPKAMARGLVPPYIKKLSKRQNQGLARALAFRRGERTPTVDQFLEEITYRKSTWPKTIGSMLILGLVLAAFAYQPVRDYYQNHRNQEIIQSLRSGDTEVVEATLPALARLDERSRQFVMDAVKEHLVNLYEQRARAAIDEQQGHYNYAAAFAYIDRVKQMYPDSATVLGIASDLENRRNRLLSDLDTRFNRYLEQGALLAEPDQGDITDVLAVIRQVDPKHPLLSDPRLPVRYAEEAGRAVQEGQLERAERFLDTGLQISPRDAALSGLSFQVKSEIQRREDERLAASIQERLRQQLDTIHELPDFLRTRDDLVTLSQLKPDSPLLAELKGRLRDIFEDDFQAGLARADWPQVEQRLFTFARLLDLGDLQDYRQRLSAAERAAGFDPAGTGEQASRIAALQAGFDELMADPRFGQTWETRLLLVLKELTSQLEPSSPWLQNALKQISIVYIDQSTQLGNENRYREALDLLARGQQLAASDALGRHMQTVREAQQRFQARQAEKARLARIEGLKQTLLSQARADRVAEARETLDNLRKALPENDAFLRETAVQALQDAYRRLATAEADQGRYSAALRLVEAGLELAPGTRALRDLQESYQDEARVNEVTRQVQAAPPLDSRHLSDELATIQSRLPKRYARIVDKLAALLADRVKDLARSEPRQASDLLEDARRLLPDHAVLAAIELKLPPKPSPLAARARAELDKGRITAANALLANAAADDARHPEVQALKDTIRRRQQQAEDAFAEGKAALQGNQRSTAREALQTALNLWSDNPAFHEALKNMSSSGAPRVTASGERPCSPSIAGYGTMARGTCYDVLGERQKGPIMVVVPTDADHPESFAIGKYEVAISDYNLYCEDSGACTPIGGDADLPLTGVSLAQAEAYAAWLSAKTGHPYRLPTDAEWVYAATAGSAPTRKDFNCRVSRGDQILKGHALISVRTGQANAWGLTNFVGNAQEWVKDGGTVGARGGAFTDSLAKCDIAMTKPHGGTADDITGFRLYRATD